MVFRLSVLISLGFLPSSVKMNVLLAAKKEHPKNTKAMQLDNISTAFSGYQVSSVLPKVESGSESRTGAGHAGKDDWRPLQRALAASPSAALFPFLYSVDFIGALSRPY